VSISETQAIDDVRADPSPNQLPQQRGYAPQTPDRTAVRDNTQDEHNGVCKSALYSFAGPVCAAARANVRAPSTGKTDTWERAPPNQDRPRRIDSKRTRL